MSKKKDLFIHGICNKTGFVKHWPRDKFYVGQDGKVYAKGNNTEPQGVEDQSVLTKASEKVLDEIADNLEKESSDQEQTPTQLPEAEPVVTASQQSEEPSQPTETKEPQMSDNNQTTTSATSEQAKEQTVNEQAQSTATESTTAAKEKPMKNQKTQKPMTATGAAVRIVLALAILFAAIFAISMGMNYAFAYIATLGLSEAAVLALSLLLGLATAVLTWFIGNAAENYMLNVVHARRVTKFEEALASAEAVTA